MLSLHSCRNASRLLLRAQEYTLQSLELFRQVCSHLSGGDGAYVVAGKVVDGGFGEHAVVCEMC